MNLSKRPKSKLRPIILTDRDQNVLEQVSKYRVASTDQLQSLCFPSAHRARKRLRALWLHGFLKRHLRPVRMGLGTSQMLYSMTPRGLARVLNQNGQEVPAKASRPSLSDHNLQINEFRIVLDMALRRLPYLTLTSWRQGRELKMTVEVRSSKGGKRVVVVPDAMFCLKSDDRDYCYCLEIDRGTTDLGRIQTKLQAYLQIWQDKTVRAKFGYRSFRLLFVTNSKARLGRILDRLQAPNLQNRRVDVLNLTTFEDYSLKNPEKLFASVWRTVDPVSGPISVCPFPVSSPSKLPTAPGKPPVRGPDA